MIKNYVILIILLIIPSKVFSQNTFKLNFGAGFPELLNAGLAYQIHDTQFGINGGTWFNQNLFTLMFDIRQHIAGESELSQSKQWYLLLSINYLYEDSRGKIYRHLHSGLRIGRYFYFTGKFGLDLNIGFSTEVSDYTIVKAEETGIIGDVDIPIYPSLSLKLFLIL